MPRSVPLRRSLLVRLVVLSAAVSAVSVVATAWLTVRTTAVAIRQEQGQTLADDARVYDALLGYAATHHDWAGAAPLVRQLAAQTTYRVTLTDGDRVVLVDSAPPGDPTADHGLPARALALVDPFTVDSALAAETAQEQDADLSAPDQAAQQTPAAAPAPCRDGERCLPGEAGEAGQEQGQPSQTQPQPTTDTIDPRAVGPFLLPDDEQQALQTAAEAEVACLQVRQHVAAEVVDTPSGRPRVETTGLTTPSPCQESPLDEPTATEQAALDELNTLVASCLATQSGPVATVALDLSWTQTTARTADSDRLVTDCVASSRRAQLGPYVAPPAQLFVSSPTGPPSTFLDLSAANRVRILEVTALVLLVTVLVTALVGTRIVRPLRAVAGAARRMTHGDLSTRARVTSGDEIGEVAAAFNTMAERRQQLEALRTAMVGDVAHELRTPVSTIRGWLEAAQDGLAVPDAALLASLHEETVLLQHVIDDLQDLSLADAGELRLHPERIDVAELLEQVVAAHQVSAETAGLTMTTGAVGRPVVLADPVRLRQAVGNLVANAVRYTPAGGRVTVRAHEQDGAVVVEVADTGPGIDAADLPHVFERFWRADRSRSRHTGGSGLGLAIVSRIAEAHGGTVSAASTLGAGSVFTLRVPVGEARLAAADLAGPR